jgi:thiol-disulfide isomerase/thioredoxin
VTHGARWSIAAVILMIAAVVAIWPRSDPATEPGPGPAAAPASSAPDLTAARAEAGLPECATGGRGPAGLRGIAAECLADGESVDIASALQGPVLVNLWATWCEPCKDELPVLAEYARQPGAVGVVTLAVESRPADALELLTRLGVRLPALLDERGRAKRELRAAVLPASYLVAADGTVTLIEDPRLFRSVDEITRAVADG